MKAELIGQLGLMGSAKFGYVGDWKGALILVREEQKGSKKPLIITIAIKSLLPRVPSMPETFELAQAEGLLSVEKRNNTIHIELPDPDEIDVEPLVAALKEYHQVLSDANCLPDVKCSECMNRQNLEVVAREDRAIRVCPDCVKRLSANEVGSGTVVMEAPPKASGRVAPTRARASDLVDDRHSLAPEPRRSGGGTSGLSPLGCATLPLTILIGGILYGLAWYGCLRVLENFETVYMKPTAIIIALVVLVPSCLPLYLHLRAARLEESIDPLFTTWFFVLLTAVIGEGAQMIFIAAFTGGFTLLEILLSPLAAPAFWSELYAISGFLLFVKGLVPVVGIWGLTSVLRDGDDDEAY